MSYQIASMMTPLIGLLSLDTTAVHHIYWLPTSGFWSVKVYFGSLPTSKLSDCISSKRKDIKKDRSLHTVKISYEIPLKSQKLLEDKPLKLVVVVCTCQKGATTSGFTTDQKDTAGHSMKNIVVLGTFTWLHCILNNLPIYPNDVSK